MPNQKGKLRVPYDEEEDARIGEETATINTEPSLTQQQYTDEVNLNVMMARMGIDDGSTIPPYFHQSVTEDKFGDFSDAPDFRTAMDRLKEATDAFNALPAKIRKEFDNSPAALMAFLADPANDDRAVELGLLNRMPEELPEGVRTRRELRQWAKDHQEEALDLGIMQAITPPEPKPTPTVKMTAT